MFFSSRPLSFYILTNDDTVFVDIRDAAAQYNSSQPVRWGMSRGPRLTKIKMSVSLLFVCLFVCFFVRISLARFYSVDVVYPAGLEEMIGAFKFCATARLFLQVNVFNYLIITHYPFAFRYFAC